MSRSSRTILAVALAALTACHVGGGRGEPVLGLHAQRHRHHRLPSNDSFLASGGSDTEFTVTLPASSACTGDTAHDGYHVWSYLVAARARTSAATTFSGNTGPSQGFGLLRHGPQLLRTDQHRPEHRPDHRHP